MQTNAGSSVKYLWKLDVGYSEYFSLRLSNSSEYTSLIPAASPFSLNLERLSEEISTLHTLHISMIEYSIDATTRTQVKRAALALRVRASVSYYVICIRSKPQKPDYASLLRARNIPFGHFRMGLCSRPSPFSRALFIGRVWGRD